MNAPKSGGEKGLRTLLILSAVGGFLVIGLRVVVFAPYRVPAGSMIPGLPVGSHIVVNKLAKTPRYGEVHVFGFPEHPEQDFVKRVIALSGDRLEMHGSVPVINGWPVPRCLVGPWGYDEDGARHDGVLFVEYLGTSTYLVFEDKSAYGPETAGPWVAKSGETWMLGDNRMNSYDSRMWFGGNGAGVPRELFHGRVMAHDRAELPAGGEKLASDLARCLASPPAVTTPPG